MGRPMAVNLAKAGHAVKGYDVVAAACDAARERGTDVAASLAAAVDDVDVVLTMLPAGEHVGDVYLSDDGVLAHAAAATPLIDSSTIDVATARAVSARAAAAGFEMLDAPVSGGVAGAAAASLTFMCGGRDDAFERARPMLEAMGKTIVHAGGAGNGQAAKICNNLILGISMIGVSEAFVLADALGLDRQKLFDIASNASGQCWSLTSYCPVPGPVPGSPANRDYRPGFTAAMMLKDLRLAQEAASSVGVSTPLGAQATAVYSLFNNLGEGATDFSGIINLIRGTS